MNVVPMAKPPSKQEAQKLIRLLVMEGKVRFHPHKNKRPQITHLQVLNCLSKGFVVEEPTQNLSHKGWMTAVKGHAAGDELKVVVCLRWKNDLLVITSYYL